MFFNVFVFCAGKEWAVGFCFFFSLFLLGVQQEHKRKINRTLFSVYTCNVNEIWVVFFNIWVRSLQIDHIHAIFFVTSYAVVHFKWNIPEAEVAHPPPYYVTISFYIGLTSFRQHAFGQTKGFAYLQRPPKDRFFIMLTRKSLLIVFSQSCIQFYETVRFSTDCFVS